MPPKTKISKNKIVKVAFEIAKDFGIDAVTVQSVSRKLNCSTQPLYWAFENIGGIKSAVIEAARNERDHYLYTEIDGIPRFRAVGLNYVRFAREQPQLFKLLFMTDREVDRSVFDVQKNEIPLIEKKYEISRTAATYIATTCWAFAHGIAAAIATNMDYFNDFDLDTMLKNCFMGSLELVKKGVIQ